MIALMWNHLECPKQMVELGFRVRERHTQELMYHTPGTRMKNGTGAGVQGDCVFAESVMPPHCDPFSQQGRNPISYSWDFAPSYPQYLFL